MTVDGIEGHDVVDVTFVNPNAAAVCCQTCIVRVSRRVRTDAVTLKSEMFLRAFNGAIRSLNPTVTVEDHTAKVRFEGDLAKELGLHSIEKDVPASFDGGATFEPTDVELMGQTDLVRRVLILFQNDAAKELGKIIATSADRGKLEHHRDSEVRTDDFLDALHEEYFRDPPRVREKVRELATPNNLTDGARQKLHERLNELLDRYPLLTDPNRHRPADPGLAASYKLTAIHGELGPVSIELDTVQARGFLAFNHRSRQQGAPHGDLPHDGLTVGTIRPAIYFRLDIDDVDVDIDAPLWLDIVSAGTVTLLALITAQGGEALVDWITEKAERQVQEAVHSAVASHAVDYGDLVADTLTTIANRDHVFHRASASRSEIGIATIDPNQLRVPHDPDYWRRRSPISGIAGNVDPVNPIDHDPIAPTIGLSASPTIALGASPDERLQRIDHFVFIMMENRSFDHMLGYLSHPDHGARADVDGLDGSDRLLGGDLAGTRALPRRGPNRQFSPNLPHDHRSIVRQINDGAMNGFASEYARKLAKTATVNPKGFNNDPERVLRFQTPDVVTTYDMLAREYAICDRWFSSVPAGTYPNRACYYSGVTPSLTNDGIGDEFGYLDELTLFDVLDHVGIDWRIFESGITFLRVFDRYRLEQERIRPIGELAGPLPPVTFIDPNFTGFPTENENNDDQPPTDTMRGQTFIDNIVNQIRAMPHWESTMIVIMYDEHGGFADHVPPPGAPGSSHPPVNGSSPISLSHPNAHTYGVRVPAFVVSPHVRPGSVAHNIYDHAAVFRTVLQRFAPQFVNSKIIPERVRRSRHLGEVLSDQPPRVATDPVPTPPPTVFAPRGLRASRISRGEPVEPEDLAAALGQLGRPTVRSRRR